MLKCWHADFHERPSFSVLVSMISELLEPLADYMDFTAFGNTTTMSVENDYVETMKAEADQSVLCSGHEVPVSHSIGIPEDDRSCGEPYEVPTSHRLHIEPDQVGMSDKN